MAGSVVSDFERVIPGCAEVPLSGCLVKVMLNLLSLDTLIPGSKFPGGRNAFFRS